MQYLWTDRLILLLGFISFSGLIFNLWDVSAITMMIAAMSGKIAKSIMYFWHPASLKILTWLIGCYIGFGRIFYGLPLLVLCMAWLNGKMVVRSWLLLKDNLPSSNLFSFLFVPDYLLNISITAFFIISIICLITWYLESRKVSFKKW